MGLIYDYGRSPNQQQWDRDFIDSYRDPCSSNPVDTSRPVSTADIRAAEKLCAGYLNRLDRLLSRKE